MFFTIAFGDLRAVIVAAFCLRDAEVRLQANYVGKGHSAYFSARLDKLFIRLEKFISLLLGVSFPDESLLNRYMDRTSALMRQHLVEFGTYGDCIRCEAHYRYMHCSMRDE